MQADCAKTTDEGKRIIEKVQNWMPIVNDRPADAPVKEIAATQVSKGVYEICWSASPKSNGLWKVIYSYIDIAGAFRAAEWEYDPSSGAIKVFNKDAMEFWTGKL